MRLGEGLLGWVDDLWWDTASCGSAGSLRRTCTYDGSWDMLISWRDSD